MTNQECLSLSHMLRPTVGRANLSSNKALIWALRLNFYYCRVCRLQLLLGLVSAVILGSQSRGTRDHIYCLRFEASLFVASYDSQVEVFDPPFKRDESRMNYVTEYKSPPTTVHLLFCIYPLLRKRVLISSNGLFVTSLSVAAETCLASRCLAMNCSGFQASCHNIFVSIEKCIFAFCFSATSFPSDLLYSH
jgi:hypothetical protein